MGEGLRLVASFSLIRDLKPRPPSSYGLQSLCQATVTNFLFSILPLHMKFLVHFSISFKRKTGQEYTAILWVSIEWMIDLISKVLPEIDNKEACQELSFILILSHLSYAPCIKKKKKSLLCCLVFFISHVWLVHFQQGFVMNPLVFVLLFLYFIYCSMCFFFLPSHVLFD